MSTEQNGQKAGTPSPERLGSPVIYCANCGCKVGRRHRRKTNKSYYVHELSKGHKGTACKKLHVHFVDRLTPHKRRLLTLGMEELRRRFKLENNPL